VNHRDDQQGGERALPSPGKTPTGEPPGAEAPRRTTTVDGTVPHQRRVTAAAWTIRVDGGAVGGLRGTSASAPGEAPEEPLVLRGDEPAPALVGTSPVCEVRLADPTVSRRHLALSLDGLRLRVRDLDSTNGTRVNGVLVREALVEGPATLELGAVRLRAEPDLAAASPTLSPRGRFGKLVGESPAMRRLYPLCERLAASAIPVVIEGETGTGKEALAESLHLEGPRGEGPFVVFDCTAVPESLLEAELFGHAKGAFTGATAARRGVFPSADGGTLLIDEIGDLPLPLQAKLLRVIDRGEVRPVGSDRTVGADVRLLAATRRDLDAEVQAGRFRDDLFHRLAVARVALPPLRERREDIPALARHLAQALGAPADFPDPALVARWTRESWPGNVRELRNAVARALALGELESLARGPKGARAPGGGEGSLEAVDALVALPLGEARARVVDAFERRYLAAQLDRHDGNVTQAAKAAGVARRYFQILRARQRAAEPDRPDDDDAADAARRG